LRELKSFSLRKTSVSGPLPTHLGSMTSLTFGLEFALCAGVTGRIPTELGNLEGLKSVSLYRTKVTGTIPTEIGRLKSLTSLDLQYTLLTGDIPVEVCDLMTASSLRVSIDCSRVNCTCGGCECIDSR
jgi:Leucine-rich repeat (LRR) protein